MSEPFALLARAQKMIRNAVQGVGNALGRNRHDRQAVRACVLFPLPAQHNLEVGHFESVHIASDAVKPDVRDMVLTATVEAAADLDVQVLDRLIQLEAFFSEAIPQFGGQTARRRDAELAGVGPRASDDVQNVAGARFTKPRHAERLVERGYVGPADPADDKVLFDGCSNRAVGEAADDVSERAKLISRDVSQRQRDRRGDVSHLSLSAGVGLQPML